MKLNEEQIKFIDKYLQKSDVIFVDVRAELIDHIASAVEEKMHSENLDFYDAFKDANHFAFYMKDEKGDVKKVIYSGTKPQDFERSEKLVLIGKMSNDTFYASKILMKCPSKYNNDLVEIKQDGQVIKYK